MVIMGEKDLLNSIAAGRYVVSELWEFFTRLGGE